MAGVISSGPYWKKLEVQITPRIRLLILSFHLAPFIISVGGLDSKVFGAFDFPHSTTKYCFHNYIGFLHTQKLLARLKIQIVKGTFYIEESSQGRLPYSQIIPNVSNSVVKDSVYRSMYHKRLFIITYRCDIQNISGIDVD